MTGPVGYCHVDDIKKSLEVVLENGGQTQQEIKDAGGGKLIATVEEADGNVTGRLQSP
jgi:predicted enzyme related to lactoylglutathione lyase